MHEPSWLKKSIAVVVAGDRSVHPTRVMNARTGAANMTIKGIKRRIEQYFYHPNY